MVTFLSCRRKIAQIASRQWGHITRGQLLGLGLASSTIDAHQRDGWLIAVHAGVYAVGYRRTEPAARAAAAVLAAGPGAVLSHGSAAALWGLRRWPATPEVTAPRRVRRPGIVAHRSATLIREDTTMTLGIRTTNAARTLQDIRARLTVRQFDRAVNRARLEHHLSFDAANTLLAGRATAHPTRSGHEDELSIWLTDSGLPLPSVNATTPLGYEVDAYYPAYGLILEMDSYVTHGDFATFHSDRERDARHAEIGLMTVRLVRDRLTNGEAERLKAILASRSPTESSSPSTSQDSGGSGRP